MSWNLQFVPYPDLADTAGALAHPGHPNVSGARVAGDQEYVLEKIAQMAESQKGDRSNASMKAMLADYDSGGKGCLNQDDLVRMLNDAGVCVKKFGICAPQSMVAKGIIDALDTDGDRCVTWAEYKVAAGITEEEAPPPAAPPPEPTLTFMRAPEPKLTFMVAPISESAKAQVKAPAKPGLGIGTWAIIGAAAAFVAYVLVKPGKTMVNGFSVRSPSDPEWNW